MASARCLKFTGVYCKASRKSTVALNDLRYVCDATPLLPLPLPRLCKLTKHLLLQQYPFVPAHISKPKECKKLFVVQMPEKSASSFSTPSTSSMR